MDRGQFEAAQAPAVLTETYQFLSRLKQALALLGTRSLNQGDLGEGGTSLVLRDSGCADIETLTQAIENAKGAAADAIQHLLGPAARKRDESDGQG